MINTFTHTFWKLGDAIKQRPRYVNSEGGTRSGKTFSALQWLIILAKQDSTPTLTSVVSETMPHLKRGAIRDFQRIMHDEWQEDSWSKVDSIYTFANGSRIEFFSADQPGKVHGPARDRLFLNESVNIEWETARQLFVRTTGLIICDYNPTHSFWMHEQIAPRENCVSLRTTYQDNDYLTPEQRAEIESNKADENWWRVYGLGECGKLDGVIYDFTQIDAMPEKGGLREVYGIDFGFSNDPTAIAHCLIDTRQRALYIDQVCYRKGLMNSDIAAVLKSANVERTTPIFCDCAEPKTIAELHAYGYNAKPCYKATRKAEQLQAIRGYALYVTKQSVDAIKEFRGYIWDKDKDGKPLNEPIPINDHFMDAFRYGVFTFLSEYSGKGQYCVH